MRSPPKDAIRLLQVRETEVWRRGSRFRIFLEFSKNGPCHRILILVEDRNFISLVNIRTGIGLAIETIHLKNWEKIGNARTYKRHCEFILRVQFVDPRIIIQCQLQLVRLPNTIDSGHWTWERNVKLEMSTIIKVIPICVLCSDLVHILKVEVLRHCQRTRLKGSHTQDLFSPRWNKWTSAYRDWLVSHSREQQILMSERPSECSKVDFCSSNGLFCK